MLSDGSLSSFAKQLTMEYNLANKNTTEVREMFGIAQWLKRQGFRLVHSQATKTSTTSYAATYVNDRIANSPSSNMLVRPEDATQILKVTGKSPNLSKRSTSAQTPKVTEHVPSLSKRTTLVPTPKVTGKVPPVSKRSASNKTPKVTEKAPTLRIRSVLVL